MTTTASHRCKGRTITSLLCGRHARYAHIFVLHRGFDRLAAAPYSAPGAGDSDGESDRDFVTIDQF